MIPRRRLPATEHRRTRTTAPRVTLPVAFLGVALTILSRADVFPFLNERVQCYVLGGAAVATLVGVLDLWENKKDLRRFVQLRLSAFPRRPRARGDSDE